MRASPKPYERGKKLMPVQLAAERLNLNPRTVSKCWKSAVRKLGGELMVEMPQLCGLVLERVYASAESDPMQCQSVECLVADGRYIP